VYLPHVVLIKSRNSENTTFSRSKGSGTQVSNPSIVRESQTKMCERLAQQGWLVNKIVKWAGFSAGADLIRLRLAWQEHHPASKEPSPASWRQMGRSSNRLLSRRSKSLPPVVSVLIVDHASNASGNGSDRSTLGTAQKTSDCCASAAAARDDQR
jgi:hypothetical protein